MVWKKSISKQSEGNVIKIIGTDKLIFHREATTKK